MNYLQLTQGERVIHSCHTHWKNFIPPFIIAGLSLLLLVVRLFFYGRPLILDLARIFPGVNYKIVSLVEVLLIVYLTLWGLNLGFKQFLIRYIITTERLIHHQGFLNTKTVELKLCYCSNLILVQNLMGKMLNYGDFKLRAGGVDMLFNDVPNPLPFKKALTEAIRTAIYGDEEHRKTEALDWLEQELGMQDK